MSQIFNADEIFKIGIQIEKNACEFYRAAASKTTDTDLKKLFSELAQWETRHISLFEDFRTKLPASMKNENAYDPENSIHMYLKSVAGSVVFVKGNEMERLVALCKSPVEILEKALNFEKDSVVFYASMKEIVPDSLGKSKIDTLVLEELNHVGTLTKEVGKFK